MDKAGAIALLAVVIGSMIGIPLVLLLRWAGEEARQKLEGKIEKRRRPDEDNGR